MLGGGNMEEKTLRLRPYKPCDAESVVSWITDEFSFRQWSADRYGPYPITPDDMNRYYDRERNNDGIWAMSAFDDAGVVGHLMMRFLDAERRRLRFGFVIVDPRIRGRGYGKAMISGALAFAFETVGVESVSIVVFENNPAAKKCYESCGFRKVGTPGRESYAHMGEGWECVELAITRQEWREKQKNRADLE